uniref:NAD(P)H dehydrogenase, quinone 1 n=1 Tax=Salarias fasciatus TaxID=181472 RepID=A0A672JTM6_SALFA
LASKTVLIVYAHQSLSSFNAAAKDAAVEVLTAQGCMVAVSDLYAMKVNLVSLISGGIQHPEHFCYAEEAKLAWEEGNLSIDIAEEQRKLNEADLVIFQDKKAMLSFTTGSQESMFSENGINGDMNVTLWPLQNGILHYCGFQVLAPQIFWAPSSVPRDECSGMLERWRYRLWGLLGEEPLSFTPLECFEKEGFQLKPEVQEQHAGQEFGLTVGIHLGNSENVFKNIHWFQHIHTPPSHSRATRSHLGQMTTAWWE